MSSTDSTPLSGDTAKPRFYTATAAYALTGIAPATVRAYAPADIWLVSARGGKLFPAWSESTLLEWAAEFRAARGETARERQAFPNRAARNLPSAGGAR
jgi:hypothetical protein